VPIRDFAIANEELTKMDMEQYYSCCGKSICKGCVNSCRESGNIGKCPFCNSDRAGKTNEERVGEVMNRVEANDAGAIHALGNSYYNGLLGLQQDWTRAIELYARAAEFGSSEAHFHLGIHYDEGGDKKKSKFHYEAAAMAGHDAARCNLGNMEWKSGYVERAVKHWMIAASAGYYKAMHNLLITFKQGLVSRNAMDSTLTAYNNACAEMRSEARDAFIQLSI
jgi:TPR repeat protein